MNFIALVAATLFSLSALGAETVSVEKELVLGQVKCEEQTSPQSSWYEWDRYTLEGNIRSQFKNKDLKILPADPRSADIWRKASGKYCSKPEAGTYEVRLNVYYLAD